MQTEREFGLTANNKTKILFDGNCIVCDTEVSHYKRIAPAKFEMVDISDKNFNAAKFGLSPEAVNKKMHVISPDGNIHKGVDAFAQIWCQIPKYQFAAKAIKWPLIYQVANVGYWIFANSRPYLPKKNRQK